MYGIVNVGIVGIKVILTFVCNGNVGIMGINVNVNDGILGIEVMLILMLLC